MNTREMAEAVGTDPKTLRAFLRASDDYNNVGSGAQYKFTKSQIRPMKKKFDAWLAARDEAKNNRPAPKPRKVKGDDDGLPVETLTRRSRAAKEKAAQISRERAARLEAALRATGKHISQAPR